MNNARAQRDQRHLISLMCVGLIYLGTMLGGCQPTQQPQNTPTTTRQAATTATPFLPNLSSPINQPSNTATRTPTDSYQPVWGDFSAPGQEPATPVPPPLTGLELPQDIKIWVLLGSDNEPPFLGRMKAIHLLIIHPRFSKLSLISIPGDLYVYIPGFTMQRLSSAYALGGIETMRETLRYNFGVEPERFVLAHPGDFQWLVDDVDQVQVTVFYPLPQVCGGIPAGTVTMDGSLALCYASFRQGLDEDDRMQRQQQLLRAIFRKFTHESYLVKLPLLYASYEEWVITDLSLGELMAAVPLALRLADPDRIHYYMMGREVYTIWELPDHSQAKVFLPDQTKVLEVMQEAISAVMIPEPLTNLVPTLQARLTSVAAFTQTANVAPINTPTPSPSATLTPVPGLIGLSPTPTPSSTVTPPGYMP